MSHLFTNEFMSKQTKKGREGRGEAMCKTHSEHSMLKGALTQIGGRQHARILATSSQGSYVMYNLQFIFWDIKSDQNFQNIGHYGKREIWF